MDDQERPPDRARIGELPHRPPKTGKPYTKEEVLALIQEAIEFHIEGLREDGQPIPPPSSSVEYVEVRAA